MIINSNPKAVKQLFPIEKDTIYRIPIYQRNYSWKEKNIEELFNDINGEDSGYYCGNLLVTKDNRERVEGITNVFEIVDGQQRLTTVLMFLLAIFEKYMEICKDNFEAKDVSTYKVIETDIPRKLRHNGEPVIKLLDKDREILKSYLSVLDGNEKGRYGNLTFAKRYKFIQDVLFNEFDINMLWNFYNKLNDLVFLQISVENISDAFSIFASLNNKGLPLTLLDLLKSKYLQLAILDISPSEAQEIWNNLVNVFKLEDEHNITHVTQFLLNNYDTFENDSNSSITKGKALDKYHALFNEKGHNYMTELIDRAKTFTFIHPDLKVTKDKILPDEAIKKLIDLQKLDSSQLYPLLLLLLDKFFKKEINQDILNPILDYLISFHVRRNVAQKPKSSNIRARVLDAISSIKKEKEEQNFINIIKESLNKISVNDDYFWTALKEPIYDLSTSTTRFILIAIERYYRNDQSNIFTKQNPDNLDEKRVEGKNKQYIWTVEHILPQNPNLSDDWKKMISPEDNNKARELQEENMHKLGNLTLTGYNSELSDNNFIQKRDYKDETSQIYTGLRTNLFLNKSIPDVEANETIDNKEKWTIKDIERRTEYLAGLVLKMYPIFDKSKTEEVINQQWNK